jgi:hypothetical protein
MQSSTAVRLLDSSETIIWCINSFEIREEGKRSVKALEDCLVFLAFLVSRRPGLAGEFQ